MEYQRHTRSDVPLLSEVEEYLGQFPGKQLRPLLVLLSAKACDTMQNGHLVIAAAMEMLHNATLMHDDVVDESDSRRGRAAVRQRWGNQVAVLCGDYYLAQAMQAIHCLNDKNVTQIVNDTVCTMCKGELKQLAYASQLLDEERYIDIIGSKTASLMAACCKLGAVFPLAQILGSQKEVENKTEWDEVYNKIRAMSDFGYHYGIVFQIRDDMHDIDSRHDATLQANVDPQQLIDRHTILAHQAIERLPDSPARQALLALLSASAPQPTNNMNSD